MKFIRIGYKIIIILAVFFTLNQGVAFALDDGFGQARKIQGQHFAIYYAPQLEVTNLAQQLNIRSSDKLLAGRSTEKKDSYELELADMVDTLFAQICDILDMQLYSFQGNIKICQDYNQMNRIYNNLFDKDLMNQRAFYVYSLNTVYISTENFKREILGHEIGHAIISHYFVVLPSVKVQEVLATYVEYQLRRIGKSE